MIPFFDRFIDTREKRYHLLLLIMMLWALWMLVPYVILGCQLLQLNSYEALFSLVQKPSIEWTYLSRIIVDAMSIATISFPNIAACLIQNIKAVEIVMFLLLLLGYGILETSRKTTITLLLLILEVFVFSAMAIVSLQAASLDRVIQMLRMMGVLMLCINGLLILLVCHTLWRQIKGYKEAMSYKIEEIKEHMDT